MTTPADPVSALTDGLAPLADDLMKIAGVGIGIGAVVLVLRKGWRLIKVLLGEVDYDPYQDRANHDWTRD